jgi:hypothetical protein
MEASAMRFVRVLFGVLLIGASVAAVPLMAQSLGNAGTIEGTVVDPMGGVVVKAEVTLHHAVNGYTQTVQSGPDGAFRLTNIPPNTYHLEVTASGFAVFGQNVEVRNSVPIQIKAALAQPVAEDAGVGSGGRAESGDCL